MLVCRQQSHFARRPARLREANDDQVHQHADAGGRCPSRGNSVFAGRASLIERLAAERGEVRFWRSLAAILTLLALALLVAALVARPAPDFSALRVVAVVMDTSQQPVWAVRLAPAAHRIAVDALHPQPAPAGQIYQLWLAAVGNASPRPLGLLPQQGRKVIPVTPESARLLQAGKGELLVSLEASGGSRRPGPTGPIRFRGSFNGS